MANAYVQVTKISNAVGRSNYIKDLERQEEVVLSKDNLTYSWEQHSAFEKDNQKSDVANNEAREIIVALPNNLYKTDKLEPFCNDLAKELIPQNHDYEYAVHWNKTRTNLHVHILFSERANQLEAEPKIYKRDMWYDKKTNKMAKAHADGAELRYKKGDIQTDKDGNVKYQTDIFTAKNKEFITREYTTKTVYEKTQEVFHKFGFKIDIQTKESPFLSQKKLYKGASEDYIEKASAWNEQVKKYNSDVKNHIELEPVQYENYVSIKKEIQSNVKESNAEEKKISTKSIALITDMANWVNGIVFNLKNYVKRKAKEFEVMERWEQSKEKFAELFSEKEKNKKTTEQIKQEIENLDVLDKSYQKVIDSKKEIIGEIEQKENQENNKFFDNGNTILWVRYEYEEDAYFNNIIRPQDYKNQFLKINPEEFFNNLDRDTESYRFEKGTSGYNQSERLFNSGTELFSGLNEKSMIDLRKSGLKIEQNQSRARGYEYEL